VSIDVETLKAERDRLKAELRELEAEQRKVEAELKSYRQREIQTKRQIEALGVLIDVNEARTQTDEETDSG
jgi:vacuolar-type H+-ATPase subunit D/Vma8